MPVRVIGMIGVAPPAGTALHVIGGGVSPSFLAEFARAHEEAGFDLVLVGYYSSSAEGFAVASYAVSQTTRLGYLIAHRPGLVAPTLAARTIATFDALWGGRLAVHIIAGNTDEDMQRDGDFTPKDERYERAAEYLEIMRRTWTCTEPFDHDGRYYRVHKVFPDVRPVQLPYPELLFGGSSPGALTMGAQHCDTFAMFGEPLAETAERIAAFRRIGRGLRPPAAEVQHLVPPCHRPHRGRGVGQGWDRTRQAEADTAAPARGGPVRQAAGRAGRQGRRPRRAPVDAGRRAVGRPGQYLMPGRHPGAGRRGDAEILPPRCRLFPDPRLRPAERRDGIRSGADPPIESGRAGDRSEDGAGGLIAGMIRLLVLLLLLVAPAFGAIDPGALDVRAFGAKGDGRTDDTAAINAVFARARAMTAVAGGLGFNTAKIVFPPGEYLVTAPINATGFAYAGLTIEGGGAILYGKMAGGVILDALGDRFLKIDNLSIQGDATTVPRVGLQIGRMAPHRSGDDHSFHNLSIDGDFTEAALNNFAAETTLYDHVFLGNGDRSPDAHAIILDGLNHWRARSRFLAASAPADRPESFDEQTFVNCIFYDSGGGAPVWMAGTHGLRMIESYVDSASAVGVILYSGAGSTFEDVDINAHFETGSLKDAFLITGPEKTPYFRGFAYKDHDSFASRAVFRQDTGIAGVTISDADIVVANFPNGTPVVFDGAGTTASWTVDGRVQIPSERDWHDFAGWSGCVVAQTTRRCTMAGLAARTLRAAGDLMLARRTMTEGTRDAVRPTDLVVAWNSPASGEKSSRIPDCAPAIDGRELVMADEKGDAGANPIILTPAGGTIDGAANYRIGITRGTITLICDGGARNWIVLGGGGKGHAG